jgi:hypothetical protein
MKDTQVQQFLEMVEVDDGCWEWLGARFPAGYGHLATTYPSCYAHRTAWIFFRGEIPEGMQVLHACDNPGCVRPDHLFLGTVADNMHDRDAKGRGHGVEACQEYRKELQDSLIPRNLLIKAAYIPGKKCHPGNLMKLAKRFHLSPLTIKRIVYRQNAPRGAPYHSSVDYFSKGKIDWNQA